MKAYLALYNLAQLLGWAYLLLITIKEEPSKAYGVAEVSYMLKVFQTFMIMEIVHSLLKIAPSPLFPTTIQVFSRLWVVYGVMDLAPESKWNFGVITMWSTAELIRYGHYLVSSLGTAPKVLVWIRYSAFIVLYPCGVFSELMALNDALPRIRSCCPRVFSFEMPNEFNFSFDYYYFLAIAVVPGYVFGFPFLYSYMLAQRRRKVGKVIKAE